MHRRHVLKAGATLALLPGVGSAFGERPAAAVKMQGSPPRKVVVATAIQGFWEAYPGVEKRLEQLRGLVEQMASQAGQKYPGRGLDLVVLPENAVTIGRAQKASERALPFAGPVEKTFADLARKYRTYIVVTLDLVEETTPPTYTNAAVLLDRQGKVAGIYRKVHPVAGLGQAELEGGITPGREFPVFNCDFGKLGIQICYDMVYDDGWAALEKKGAELVVWPSASPATAQPASRARQHRYYVVSSTYRHNASIFEPTGMTAAQIRQPERTLVQELDLSYVLLPWSGRLRNGQAFHDRYGDRAGYRYYEAEDLGIFWSNDPKTPIHDMVRELGLTEVHADVERNRRIQDRSRPNCPFPAR